MKRFLVIVLLLLAVQLQAQVRMGREEAFASAERFLEQNGKQVEQTLTLSEEIKSNSSDQTNLFVFSVEPQGFVVISALSEVLAYSFESVLPVSNELPAHINYWLDLYNQQTDYLVEHPEQVRTPSKGQKTVEPLLTCKWGQGCFHNAACPSDANGPCHRASAGCVAIAMAQIMYYHKHPEKGHGTMTYSCPPYGTLSTNFAQTTYQWDAMADTLHDYNSAVAKLISHCGIGVKMQYGPHLSVASNAAAIDALHQFFSYPLASLLSRNKYSDEEWLSIIRENLDKQRPVYYTGISNLGGHAFDCDGYDSLGLFHFNFGWDGVGDGYYTLDDPSGFSENQSIIHDFFPISDIPIHSDEHGIIYVSPDGTGDGSSWEQATNELQLAIYKSYLGYLSIWVKEGVYSGFPTDYYAFYITSTCRLYGGFKGDEPFDYNLSQRDFEAHPSVLDGNNTQGVLRVLTSSKDDLVLIDGFTIQNGKSSHGGGIRLVNQVHLKNCKICHNYAKTNGGGLAHSSQSPGPLTIEDCEFYDNEARASGGAIYDYGNATFLRCRIHDNIAKHSGGGIYSSTHEPSHFINCTINNNFARCEGGGISSTGQGQNFWSCLINNNTANLGGGCSLGRGNCFYNCTIVKNEALDDYGGVYYPQSLSNDEIKNCIIWGNVSSAENTQIGPSDTYSYCAVQDDLSGTETNFEADANNDGTSPYFYVRFQNPNVPAGNTGRGGDWRLRSDSPCIDRVNAIAGQPATDLESNPRCRHNNVDLGAYESDVAAQLINAYYCEDEPYHYEDSLISELGTYTFLHQSQPYDHLDIVVMQNPPPTVFLMESICEKETYDFFGTILSEPGIYTTTERCVTYKLNLNVKPLATVPMEEEICDGEAFDFFGEFLYDAGHYSKTVGCKTYELDLTVNPSNNIPVYMEEEICEGETYNFFGRTLYYEGVYSTDIGCNNMYWLDLTINPRPALQCTKDTLVEYKNPIQLVASGADTYLWSTGDTTESITIFPLIDRTYSVTGFSKNGCSSTASVTVKVCNEDDEIILYPNPAGDQVEVYMPLIDEVEVFNLLGEPIEHVLADRQPVRLDVSRYVDGMYVVHVRQMKKHSYKKLIIRH